VQNGQEESRGLTATCGRVGQEVATFETCGDCFRLNGSWVFETQIFDTSQKGRVKLECRKYHNVVRFLGTQQAGRIFRLDKLAHGL